MKIHDEPLCGRALEALADQCEIPADVEERILAAALGSLPAPIIALAPPERVPLEGVIRVTREDDRRWRRMTWGAAAVFALLLGVAVTNRPAAPPRAALPQPTSIQMAAAPPAGVRGAKVAANHPRLEEAKLVLFVAVDRIARECKEDGWSALVRFERSGQATLVDVRGASGARSCIEKVVLGAQISAREGPRLAVWIERASGGAEPRIEGWLLDEV